MKFYSIYYAFDIQNKTDVETNTNQSAELTGNLLKPYQPFEIRQMAATLHYDNDGVLLEYPSAKQQSYCSCAT